MSKTEKENLKLKAENKHLKDEVDNMMRIYRENLYEMVDLKMKIDLIEYALHGAQE